MTIGLLADGLLIVLLGAALVSVYRLNRRMAELRQGREAFEKLTGDLAVQTKAAADGLAAFRANAETLGKQLEAGADRGRQVIAEVQRVSDDLRLLIGRADASSNRLEGTVAKGRRDEALMGAIDERPAQRDQTGSAAEPDISPEAAAFLSSLSGMR